MNEVPQLVTLPQASTACNEVPDYFRIRRYRFRYDAEHPFPQPVMTVAGADVFDLHELIVWDTKRKADHAAKVAERQAVRDRAEAARAERQQARSKR